MSTDQVLVVANRTLGGEPLFNAIARRVGSGPCTFHVVVPATIPSEGWVYTEAAARAQAERRLVALLKRLADIGVTATGEVGDANPIYAIGDALRTRHVDAMIISTLPFHVSKWLRQDLPRRAARQFGIHVEHIVSDKTDQSTVEPIRKGREHHESQTA